MDTTIKNNDKEQNLALHIYNTGIIPVATIKNQDDAIPVCEALCKGGIDIIEISSKIGDAAKAITDIKKKFPDMLVGVGTVIGEKQAKAAEDAGADFLSSPGFDCKVVEYCKRKKLPIFPGCTTATEYQAAIEYELDIIKFFPAEQAGGVAMIKALCAPFPMIKVIPTGGISLDNIESYISCPNVLACGGSYMVAQKLIDDKQWDKIEEISRWSVEKVLEARRCLKS